MHIHTCTYPVCLCLYEAITNKHTPAPTQPQAVYSVLVEAEHRSTTPLPYWNLPFANLLVPRLRKFNVSRWLGNG